MQEDRSYHSPAGYVYTRHHALELDAVWRGVDRLERRGVPLDQIARRLAEDWETTVITLAMIGRRRP
jgi:hypothetical protein